MSRSPRRRQDATEFLTGGGAVSGAIEAPAAAAEKTIEVEKGAKIVFSGWGDETEQKIYRDSIARFNKVYPGVTVDYQPIPADFQTKLKAQMAAAPPPDVLYVDNQLMTAFGADRAVAGAGRLHGAGRRQARRLHPAAADHLHPGRQDLRLCPRTGARLGLVYLPEAFTAGRHRRADRKLDVGRPAERPPMRSSKAGKYSGFCMAPTGPASPRSSSGTAAPTPAADFKTATLDTPEVKTAAELRRRHVKDEGDLVHAI